MKMQPEHYEQLRESIQSLLKAQPKVTVQSHRDLGLTAERFRWDALHASGFDTSVLYDYLDDKHIDTAIRRITGTN